MLSLTTAEKIGPQAGSNQGGLYLIDGVKYYVKRPRTPEHGRVEALASVLYRVVGIPAPQVFYSPEEGYLFSRIVEGEQDMHSRMQDGEWLRKLRQGYAVDAWLANWDVFGMVWDNIITDAKGTPWRIDNGGALTFRAMGARKEEFGPEVTELDTFLTGKKAQVFGGMSREEMEESVSRLRRISPDEISWLVMYLELPEDLANTLIARRENILQNWG